MIEEFGEGTAALEQAEIIDKHATTSVEVENGQLVADLDASREGDVGVDVHQQLVENVTGNVAVDVTAVSGDGSSGEACLDVPTIAPGACSAQDGGWVTKDADQQETGTSEHVDTERKESISVLGDENDTDGDKGPSENLKDISSAKVDLVSSSAPESLFNDANRAQLQAQILVMGILR